MQYVNYIKKKFKFVVGAAWLVIPVILYIRQGRPFGIDAISGPD